MKWNGRGCPACANTGRVVGSEKPCSCPASKKPGRPRRRPGDAPTKRQQEVLAAIVELSDERPPTVRELGDRLGMSANGALRHLKALRDKGLVTWEDRSPRTLRVVEGSA